MENEVIANPKISDPNLESSRKSEENLPEPNQKNLDTQFLTEEIVLPEIKPDPSDLKSPITLEQEKIQGKDEIDSNKVVLDPEVPTDHIRNHSEKSSITDESKEEVEETSIKPKGSIPIGQNSIIKVQESSNEID